MKRFILQEKKVQRICFKTKNTLFGFETNLLSTKTRLSYFFLSSWQCTRRKNDKKRQKKVQQTSAVLFFVLRDMSNTTLSMDLSSGMYHTVVSRYTKACSLTLKILLLLFCEIDRLHFEYFIFAINFHTKVLLHHRFQFSLCWNHFSIATVFFE